MALTNTKILYLQKVWNVSGWGCARDPHCYYCYAKTFAKRGMSKCPQCNAFQVHQHPERLNDPLYEKEPHLIGVDYMSDLFHPSVEVGWQKQILMTVNLCDGLMYPPHKFVFLTKSPENLALHNPWPSNAWVGCTIDGTETPERQQAMKDALLAVEGAGGRWISYEPALGPLRVNLEGIDWLAVGADSSRGAKQPDSRWISEASSAAKRLHIPLWQKINLLRKNEMAFLSQELPKGLVV